MTSKRHLFAAVLVLLASALAAQESPGYYRYPAVAGDVVVFAAEEDLWRVSRSGGLATRLTTHLGEELYPALSPDGKTLAFSAAYEGPREVYTMPAEGGLPVRRTFEGGDAKVVGWTPGGKILYSTTTFSGLPDRQLMRLDPASGRRSLIPLAQASDGCFTADGKILFFTRFAFQGSHTKRYQGGTAQNLWRFAEGDAEAAPLTADHPGTSRTPMWWQGRVYFASDRDGTVNLWSMDERGGDLKQHTAHRGWDVTSPAMSEGRIVYQLGADLRIFDAAAGQDAPLAVRLASDFDQMRETWVDKPMDFLTTFAVSPKGDRVALTARGQVFVAPVGPGRIVEVTRKPGVRYREARFLGDGKDLVALSDESGEIEIWRLPANGVGAGKQLTSGGKVLRWEGVPSPDGRLIAHDNKDRELWLLDVESGQDTKIAVSTTDGFHDLTWSPDGKWLAYATAGANTFTRIYLYSVATGRSVPLTSDRFNSVSPAWSPDGRWIWFLSDRNLVSLVGAPWGSRQPDPFLTSKDKIFGVALKKGLRSPFAPPDELHQEGEKKDQDKDQKDGKDKDTAVTVEIELEGLAERQVEAPVPPGNYRGLTVTGERLYWLSRELGANGKTALSTVALDGKEHEVKKVMEDVADYRLTADGKKLLVRRKDDFYVFGAAASAPSGDELGKSKIDLSRWTFSFDPKEQWQQMFREAWRLHRDYFYDRSMHGVDWPAMREKYLPLARRVTSRGELDDVLGQMVSELSALHTFVGRGQYRQAEGKVEVASLGAVLERDEAQGGWRIERIYRSDPDLPAGAAPLARPEVAAAEGDVIEAVNGVATLSVADPGMLLRRQAGRQVLLRIKDGKTRSSRDAVAVPVSADEAFNLRYTDWELERRARVEEAGQGRIGYVHLRAMGRDDYTSWARDFYPVFNRPGLIIDVRHNEGGNIESWILAKLLRKAWFWWQPRVGEPYSNMQYAYRGHLAVLVDEWTASDGEAFAEGIKRLGLGKVLGTRTWGGEIWLTSSNILVDHGIASAAEFGVYGPDAIWLIEGHGVEPDVVVDNLPHATFKGSDAQLDAAVRYLEDKITKEPVEVPKAPPYPKMGEGGEP